MKVAIGFRTVDGPWGGGNRFAKALDAGLRAAGHTVRHDLKGGDEDIILLTDPRWRNPSTAFTAGPILRHLAFRNPRAVVVHRVNECDERKGTTNMNAALLRANYCADFTVFVGAWLAELPVWRNHLRAPWTTILNGADPELFHPRGFAPWTGEGPLNLVTHHWGGNRMKGFDVYERLDALLDDPAWRGRLGFTYIGNLPPGFRFRNARHLAPLDGPALADALRSHHGYVTASINEPGPNHQNEGALCGLPLLYRRSGALPEYCTGFGIGFDGPDNFEASLSRYVADYPRLLTPMPTYPHTTAHAIGQWIALFTDLTARRAEIVAERRLWRDPLMFLRNQMPF